MLKRRYLSNDAAVRIRTRQPQGSIPGNPCKAARWLIKRDFVVWDTETTGLDNDARIVSIGIVDADGKTLCDTLINPQMPIPRAATNIHGITNEMVADAPTFLEAYDDIRLHLDNKIWAIYNTAYDMPRLRFECRRNYLPLIEPRKLRHTVRSPTFIVNERPMMWCAMLEFAEHYGEWNDYHGNYRWQSLATAADYYNISIDNAHNALADAMTTYKLIRHMAMDD